MVTAIVGAVGAVAGLAGSAMQSSAAQSAADTQAAAADRAAAAAQEQYKQQREDLTPWRTTGQNALAQLSNIFGLGGSPPAQSFAPPPAPSYAQQQSGGAADPWFAAQGLAPVPNYAQFGMADYGGRTYIYSRPMTGDPTTDKPSLVGTIPIGGDLQSFMAQTGEYPTSAQAASASSQGAAPSYAAAQSPGDTLAQYGLSGLTYTPTAAQQAILSHSSFNPTQAQLEATPGYQFDLSQGLKSVQSANAAKGLGVSGAALKGAAKYATGLANNTLTTQAGIFNQNYNNNLNAINNDQGRFQTNLGNVLNPLMTLSSGGQSAANQTGAFGGAATAASNAALIGGANAQAAGQVGSANALASGANNASSSIQNSYFMNKLLSNNSGGGGGSSLPAFDAFAGNTMV